MTAFDKHKKQKDMPNNNWIIKDNTTELYCTSYSTSLPNCVWGDIEEGQIFTSKPLMFAAIAEWGTPEEPIEEGRFIGKNPPPH